MLVRSLREVLESVGLRMSYDERARQVHCLDKRSFRRPRDAKDWLDLAEESSRDAIAGMRVYRCKYQPHFHVGHP